VAAHSEKAYKGQRTRRPHIWRTSHPEWAAGRVWREQSTRSQT